MYPYEWAATRLLIQLPQWVQAGGPDALLARIADGSVRDRLRGEMAARGAAYASAAGWSDVRLGYFAEPGNARWEGRTLAEVMDDTGTDPVDAICDLLLSEDLRVTQVTSGPETDDARALLRAPGGDDRHGLHLPGRAPIAAHLRLVPAGARRVRARARGRSVSRRRSAS